MSRGTWAAVGFCGLAGLGGPIWALEGELDVQVIQTHVASPQEVAVDRTLAQGTLSHAQALAGGLSLEGTLWASLDTLPSQTPQVLPHEKLALAAKVLEAWASWSPLPGALTFGAGKRVLHSSSGFSHTPLNFVSRGGATSGAEATSLWEEGWVGAKGSWFGDGVSASAFYAPALGSPAGGPSQAFAQGQVGVSLGTTDLQFLVFQGAGRPRLGGGVDAGWGDELTLRAEVSADADEGVPRWDSLGGATWTLANQTTVMAELSRDETASVVRNYGFLRVAGDLDAKLAANAWSKVNLVDRSGWLGAALTYTADHWALVGSWKGAWGSASTDAGSSVLRWQTVVEVKAFL